MWKDAPAALCEFAEVDPARKWAQCEKERDGALIELQKMREEIERKIEIIQELVEAHDMALDEIESLMARNAQWATIARRAMAELDKVRKMR